jgi:hypothetical protein
MRNTPLGCTMIAALVARAAQMAAAQAQPQPAAAAGAASAAPAPAPLQIPTLPIGSQCLNPGSHGTPEGHDARLASQPA